MLAEQKSARKSYATALAQAGARPVEHIHDLSDPLMTRRRLTMADLNIRPASECRFDAVSLGEVMLRLDPGEGRIRTARSFRAWEGGGEYNATRGLRRAFGLRAAVVTALADNEIGRLVE